MFQVFESAYACEARSQVAGNLLVETLQTPVRVHTEMRVNAVLGDAETLHGSRYSSYVGSHHPASGGGGKGKGE